MPPHHPAQPLPTVWLMTDARNRADLPRAISALPRGAGVVFRDSDLGREERRRHFRDVAALCTRRRLTLLIAGDPVRGDWRADGRHNSRRSDRPIRSCSVHDASEARAARTRGADLSFVSPVWPTRSHPDADTLGCRGFNRLARLCPGQVIALGGVSAERWHRLRRLGADGWAAIDSLDPTQGQKRKAVPT